MHALNDWRVLTQLLYVQLGVCTAFRRVRERQEGLRIEAISFSTMAARWCDLYDGARVEISLHLRCVLHLERFPPTHALSYPSFPPQHFYGPTQAGEITEVYFNRSICHDLRPLIDCPIDKPASLACKLV